MSLKEKTINKTRIEGNVIFTMKRLIFNSNIEITGDLTAYEVEARRSIHVHGAYRVVGSDRVGEFQTVGGSQEVGKFQEIGKSQSIGGSQKISQYQKINKGQTVNGCQNIGNYQEIGTHQKVNGYQKVGGHQNIDWYQEVSGPQEVGGYQKVEWYQKVGGLQVIGEYINFSAVVLDLEKIHTRIIRFTPSYPYEREFWIAQLQEIPETEELQEIIRSGACWDLILTTAEKHKHKLQSHAFHPAVKQAVDLFLSNTTLVG